MNILKIISKIKTEEKAIKYLIKGVFQRRKKYVINVKRL
ncbi:hypothetical protein H312_01008 [Anncaliia algerae PRA339]|uniref:Uncharacterized protein n=1 Tax=Anncaliia algerae PRA339 TaxID=1288291 RepID=A0A059F315_9MICR|nr:hypothetical protein H312_01008 [Anncaliia algerae PRA339]